MSRSLSRLRRGLLGIAFVGSLGFGASQALAASTPTTHPYACDASWQQWCRDQCGSEYAQCHWYGAYYCECIYA